MGTEARWGGLDLGLRTTHVCIVDDAGATVREETCETTLEELAKALSFADRSPLALIAAEAGNDTHIVRKLRDAGFPVALFEARKASRFLAIRKNKTDASDAHGLADLARLGRHTVSQVHLKSPECQRLQGQLAMRQKLIRLRVGVEGVIRSRLALYGRPLNKLRTLNTMKSRVATEVAYLRDVEGIDIGEELLPLLDVAQSLRNYGRDLDRRLAAAAKEHPVCSRLMGVTGIGPICSLSFYSAIEDPFRFSRASDVAAFLGLVPRRIQSGDISYTGRITKNGNRMTRAYLVNATLVFISKGPDSALKDWALALRGRIGWAKARVALARKLAIVLLKMWTTGSEFESYPQPAARISAD